MDPVASALPSIAWASWAITRVEYDPRFVDPGLLTRSISYLWIRQTLLATGNEISYQYHSIFRCSCWARHLNQYFFETTSPLKRINLFICQRSIRSLQTLSSLNIILLIFELDCLGLNHFARIVKILMDPTDSLAEGFYYDSIFRLLALCLTELVKVVWDFN